MALKLSLSSAVQPIAWGHCDNSSLTEHDVRAEPQRVHGPYKCAVSSSVLLALDVLGRAGPAVAKQHAPDLQLLQQLHK